MKAVRRREYLRGRWLDVSAKKNGMNEGVQYEEQGQGLPNSSAKMIWKGNFKMT